MVAFSFYYTLIIMLYVAFAAAACFSGFLVSRRKSFAFGTAMFLFYFFDVSIVFYHDFIVQGAAVPRNLYDIQSPYLSVLMGAGAIGSLWLLICEKLHNDFTKHKGALFFPIITFIAVSVAILQLVDDSQLMSFLFFSARQVFYFFIFTVYFVWYFKTASTDRHKIRPKPSAIVISVLLTLGILVEDFITMFPMQDYAQATGALSLLFFSERSVFENLLFVWLGIVLIMDAWKTIEVHYTNPPVGSTNKSLHNMEAMLPRYCDLHDLTPRERDVLHLILLGKDNANIATELTLAVGTVKVHIHNILKKTGNANRHELIQDFWKMR